jgi:hypothetical protein
MGRIVSLSLSLMTLTISHVRGSFKENWMYHSKRYIPIVL